MSNNINDDYGAGIVSGVFVTICFIIFCCIYYFIYNTNKNTNTIYHLRNCPDINKGYETNCVFYCRHGYHKTEPMNTATNE